MIRTTAVPRRVRTGVAVVGIAGAFAFTGCAANAADAESEPTTGTDTSTSTPTTSVTPSQPAETPAAQAPASTYTDGSYTAAGSYQTPESVEEITVTVTLAGDVVTAVEVSGNPTKAESRQYQSEFIGGISEVVIGKDIDELSVSRVAGSSLTSGGFNAAIEQIKSEAVAA